MALHLKSTGIDFADFSNSGSMTSELMDAYEEGRFTAVSSSGGSIATGQSILQYIKVGNHCTLCGQFQQGSGQTSGNLALQSLPFANTPNITNHNALAIGSLRVWNQALSTGYSNAGVLVNIESNASTMEFYINRDNNTGAAMQRDDSAYLAFTVTFQSQ